MLVQHLLWHDFDFSPRTVAQEEAVGMHAPSKLFAERQKYGGKS